MMVLYPAASTEQINDATEGHGPAHLRWVLPALEPCEHGNFAQHLVWMNDNGTNLQCEGAPK